MEEVQIISRDMIKPSAPTPGHLRTYKLSLLDQIAPNVYNPIVLFYSPASKNPSEKSDRLKKSLSKALTQFYPLAGRLKDDFTVDCNDEGAAYIEARIASDMSTVFQQPDIHQELQKLLPCDPYEKSPELSSQLLLSIKVTHFGCGGVAIGTCVWHGVADASSMGTFVKSWAEIGRAENENVIIDGLIHDCTSLFAPQALSLPDLSSDEYNRQGKSVMKRFVFDGSKMAALRGKIGNGPYLDRPTRFEAVATLIWGSIMTSTSVTGEDQNEKMKTLVVSVDLRRRMDPALPQQAIGNILQMTMANRPKEEGELDYNCLAGKLHDSIKLINNDYVRNLYADTGFYVSIARKAIEEFAKNPNGILSITSWCRFPFYEGDFGWGRPIWVGCGFGAPNCCFLLDSRDGEGIEAWVGLSKEDMAKFERNPDIVSYASLNPKPF